MGIDKQNKIADRRKADFSVKRLWAFGLPLQIGITYLRCIGTPRICVLNSNFLALIVLRSQRYNIPFYSTTKWHKKIAAEKEKLRPSKRVNWMGYWELWKWSKHWLFAFFKVFPALPPIDAVLRQLWFIYSDTYLYAAHAPSATDYVPGSGFLCHA